jgi:hypothetical protein
LGTGWSRGRVLLAFALLVTVGVIAVGLGAGIGQAHRTGGNQVAPPPLFAPQPAPAAHGSQPPRVPYAHLPLIFEPNQGQSDPRVKFLARGSGYGLFLTRDEAVLALQPPVVGRQSSAKKLSVVRMKLAGANASPALIGTDELPGKSNYFIGNNPAKWHRNVPQFARVRYLNVYPGIDLVYYGNQGRLEYDFEVAPGADPRQVVLRFQGLNQLRLHADGNLLIAMSSGSLRLEAPRVYQRIGQEPKPVAGRFALLGKDKVGFELGPYDPSRALVIDPVLTYSTYLGGSGNEGCSVIAGIVIAGIPSPPSGCPAIAVDSANGIGGPGNIYVAGSTTSSNFRTTTGVFQPSLAGGTGPNHANLFLSKFDPTGATLIFSTYLGGDGTDTSAGVAVDSALNVYVAGTTSSTNFPTTPSIAFQPGPVPGAKNHVFVSQLKPDGSALLYSTYLVGNGTETATGLALDVHSKVYVSGTTTSTNPPTTALFPATLGAFQTCPGEKSGNCALGVANQFFFSKLDPTLSGTASLVYSTYIGGSMPGTGVTADETRGGGIAVDTNAATPNVYVTGGTNFTDMPVLNASQGMNAGGIDAWVAKFTPSNPTGTQEIYLTYLGGTGDDIGNGVAVDSGGNAYLTGSTTSTNITIPTGTTPFQKCLDVPPPIPPPTPCPTLTASDAFVAKFGTPCTGTSCTGSNGTNVPLNYFSYLGGSGTDVGLAIAVDSIQGARLTGWTNSTDFPHPNNPIQSTPGGLTDAFVTRIDTTAASSTASGHFSTYLGGSLDDFGTSIAIDAQANTLVAGETASPNPSFPITANAFQPALNGPTDAFVSKLGPVVNLTMTASVCTTPPCTVGIGNPVTFKYTITNAGDLTTGITVGDNTAGSIPASLTSASASPGTCGSATGGIVLCNIGTLNAGTSATVTIILTPTAPTTPNNMVVTLTNSATANVLGSTFSASASASTLVNDFSMGVAPATTTEVAGVPASYSVTVTPTQNSATAFPDTVALSVSSGLPTGATATFPNGASIPNLNNGAQSRQLVINTTPRITTGSLWQGSGLGYATWLPVSGLVLLGVGIGGMGKKMSRQRRGLLGVILGGFFALILLQVGCGSSKSKPITTGTPAGTYSITVTATSGSATRTQPIQLVVQ